MVITQDNCATFRFFRPEAQSVHLVGDFNGWGCQPLAMIRAKDGYWVAAIQLPAGDYRFQYVADGEGYLDYAAFGLDFGPYGADSIVKVTGGRVIANVEPKQTVCDERRVA